MSHQDKLETIGDEAFTILSQFYEYDRDVPLDARVFDREEQDTYVREKIVFRSVRNRKVPGYLAIPTDTSPPYPCILLLHGLGTSKEDWWVDSSDEERLTRELLSSGFAIMALDIEYHGERTYNSDYESAWSMVVDHGRVNQYREMLVQSAGDHRRAIDYLITRPEINKESIGLFGRSVGGVVTYIVSGIDSRFKAAVASSTLPMSDYHIECLGWEETAKERLAPVAPRNFAPRIKQAAFLMFNGGLLTESNRYTIR